MFTKRTTTITAAALFLSGSAFVTAAFAAPDAGEHPWFNQVMTTSQLKHGTVEAEAVAHPPAVGEFSALRSSPLADPHATRAGVESRILVLPLSGDYSR